MFETNAKSTSGTWPENCGVERDGQNGRIRLRTRFYEVEHDLACGGAIHSIVLRHGTGSNLLASPMACGVVLADGTALSDAHAPATACKVGERGDDVDVTIEAPLAAEGSSGNAVMLLRTTYEYRWGRIRVRREFLFPEAGLDVSQVVVADWRLRADIDRYGVRSGAPAHDPTYCGECRWGRARPGDSYDYPYFEPHVPRHVVFGHPGCEGIEWFSASDLAQWTHGVCGEVGHGGLLIAPESVPGKAVRFQVSALRTPRRDLRLREAVFNRTLVFDSRIGLPILHGQAHAPFLHASFMRNHWPTEDEVASWAKRGVRTAHFHHDGDTFHDGLFWRDGAYPPFGPEDMAEFDRVVEACHRHGIRVTTYFSNKELHPTVDAYRKHGREWARLPDGRNPVHNLYEGDEYGAQMCLRSGWMDFFKRYVETVLEHHPLDGIYYDWNQAIFCNNPAHAGGAVPGPGADNNEKLFADLSDSRVAHWDMDELIELMEWTRRRVGPDGMVIIHNTMNPCMAAENFADYVIGMEWGSGQLLDGVPDLEELPFEWSFVGARTRGVITGGCVAKDAPGTVYRRRNLQCLLTGVYPWRSSDLDLEMLGPLARLDMRRYRFLDWRSGAVECGHPAVRGAVYDGGESAVVVLANFAGTVAAAHIRLSRKALALTEAQVYRTEDLASGQSGSATAERLFETGLEIDVPACSAVLLRYFI